MTDDGQLINSPQVLWGVKQYETLYKDAGLTIDYVFDQKLENDEGYRIQRIGKHLTISALTPKGALYGLVDLAEKIRHQIELPEDWSDKPALKLRGYALGLQKPKEHYSGHKAYDWPVTPEHFSWFYDKEHMEKLLNLLAEQRCNFLCFWSGHPFSYFVTLDRYPEMQELTEEEMKRNREQLLWICREGEKRGISIFFQFYNIHMPPLLSKARNWEVQRGEATDELCDYTKDILSTFSHAFPMIGFMVCMGELLREEDQSKWLNEVILQGILQSCEEDGRTLPPVVLRGHQFAIEEHYERAKELYPNLWTMNKHNGEALISYRTDERNRRLSEQFSSHITNIHLCSNLEPFTWGGVEFIRNTVAEIVRQGCVGVHVYPLRYWDWPNSSHVNALGDQLDEHCIWWRAWGRYSWNFNREKSEEKSYWTFVLKKQYGLDDLQSELLYRIFDETSEILPRLSQYFLLSSGNRQSLVLGQYLVTMAFNRTFYLDVGYSMSQLCGYEVIGERFWSPTLIDYIKNYITICLDLLKEIDSLKHLPEIFTLMRKEINVLYLLLSFFKYKAIACALYFQSLYGVPKVTERDAFRHLEKSVKKYRELSEETKLLFVDAGSVKHHRRIPFSAKMGFEHWKDCLLKFEEELLIAEVGGIKGLLRHYQSSVNK